MNTADGGVITKVVKIGNSQGIRIPKLLIEQCGLYSQVSLTVQDGWVYRDPSGLSAKSRVGGSVQGNG